ncbi:MAG: recombinase family protein, partial [Clostridia bacterium]|nr:recombinase family protein [Clostridia bacterium]
MEIPKRVVHERPVLFRLNMTAITSNIVVCAYARVSTEDEEQEESYKRQIEHFTVLIKSHSNWQFGGVYADHGITGKQAE